MPPNLSPQDALNNLAQVADATALNGPDRRTIDTSIHVLQAFIAQNAPAQEANKPDAPKGDGEPEPGDVVNENAKTGDSGGDSSAPK